MLVKVCGITNLEDALKAIEYGADALGFNFYPQSPRYLEPSKAKKLLEDVPPSILRVGVFVNENEALVQDLSQILSLDYLQFHGDETPYYCEQFATPYWKAFRLKDMQSIELMKKYHCEHYLIDAYVEGSYGGTGKVVPIELAQEAKKAGRIILAGGLNPSNVSELIFKIRPDGVDVSSGVEMSPGQKDWGKMRDFIARAKGLPVEEEEE